MNLLPHFPLHLSSMALFGLTLLLGLIGGELAKRTRYLPIISGYIVIGFLVGPGGLNLVNSSVLATARFFVEISLSLVLFELGRHLDFRWLLRDRSILPMAITECAFTFFTIFAFIYYFVGLSWLQSALAGTIAMATSPAVIMTVAHDLSAEGPVTRRTFILTSLNNLISLILFTFLLPMAKSSQGISSISMLYTTYQIVGSLVLGLCMFGIAEIVGVLIGKNKQNQFILFVSLVALTSSFSHIFNFSTLLALFVLGVAARNFDRNHILMEIDFSWLARLFFILLFVVTGAHLQLKGLSMVFGAVVTIIVIRTLAKSAGIFLFAKSSNLSKQQALAICLALTPMAGLAIGMSNILIDYNPEFGHHLLLIITGVLTVLHILGPVATQLAFIMTKETLTESQVKYGNALCQS